MLLARFTVNPSVHSSSTSTRATRGDVQSAACLVSLFSYDTASDTVTAVDVAAAYRQTATIDWPVALLTFRFYTQFTAVAGAYPF